jgi:uncharacterized integral membrane protein
MPSGQPPARRSARSRADRARLIFTGVLGGLAVAFAFLNLGRVEVDWILGTWQTPLILVIAVSLLVGAVLGFFFARRRYALRSSQSPRLPPTDQRS